MDIYLRMIVRLMEEIADIIELRNREFSIWKCIKKNGKYLIIKLI